MTISTLWVIFMLLHITEKAMHGCKLLMWITRWKLLFKILTQDTISKNITIAAGCKHQQNIKCLFFFYIVRNITNFLELLR